MFHYLSFYANSQKLCEHEKLHGAHLWQINIEHYVDTLQRKPGALLGSVAWQQAPRRLKAIYEHYYADQPRAFIELMHYMKQQDKGLDTIEAAIDRLKIISSLEITTDKIKLVCERQTEPQPVACDVNQIEQIAQHQLTTVAQMMPDNMSLTVQEVVL